VLSDQSGRTKPPATVAAIAGDLQHWKPFSNCAEEDSTAEGRVGTVEASHANSIDGVPLALGAVVFDNRIGEIIDDRRDYGEIRINAFGLVTNRLFVCTDTMRGITHRLIPVRKASRQEQRTWLR
jgi:hypothetical protein